MEGPLSDVVVVDSGRTVDVVDSEGVDTDSWLVVLKAPIWRGYRARFDKPETCSRWLVRCSAHKVEALEETPASGPNANIPAPAPAYTEHVTRPAPNSAAALTFIVVGYDPRCLNQTPRGPRETSSDPR